MKARVLIRSRVLSRGLKLWATLWWASIRCTGRASMTHTKLVAMITSSRSFPWVSRSRRAAAGLNSGVASGELGSGMVGISGRGRLPRSPGRPRFAGAHRPGAAAVGRLRPAAPREQECRGTCEPQPPLSCRSVSPSPHTGRGGSVPYPSHKQPAEREARALLA